MPHIPKMDFCDDFTKCCTLQHYDNILNDKNITTSNIGLCIDNREFTKHVTPGQCGLHDHNKSLFFRKNCVNITCDEYIYEGCISSCQQVDLDTIPQVYIPRIRNVFEDYRICSAGIITHDENIGLTIMILITNDYVYGLYYCDYNVKPMCNFCPTENEYRTGFISVIPLTTVSTGQMIQVGIGMSSQEINFYVNKNKLYTITNIGTRLKDEYQVCDFGGPNISLHLSKVRLGFGQFTFLDHNIPNNYARNFVTTEMNVFPVYRLGAALAQLALANLYREPYPSFSGEHAEINPNITFAYTGTEEEYFIFGQGVITYIKTLSGFYNKICEQSKVCKKESVVTSLAELYNQSKRSD